MDYANSRLCIASLDLIALSDVYPVECY